MRFLLTFLTPWAKATFWLALKLCPRVIKLQIFLNHFLTQTLYLIWTIDIYGQRQQRLENEKSKAWLVYINLVINLLQKEKSLTFYTVIGQRNVSNGLLIHQSHILKRLMFTFCPGMHISFWSKCIYMHHKPKTGLPHYSELEHICCSVRCKWKKVKHA